MSDFLNTFAELNASFAQGEGEVLTLPVDQVVEDPNQPREAFDEEELEALAGSVRRRGVLQPIVVRPPGPDGLYMIRFGARRYRAARRAGLTEVRALVRAGEAGEADGLIEQVIENEQRAGLSTAELARTVGRLLDLGLSQADIGRELGRPKDVVAMLAAVRKMPPVLQGLASRLGPRTLYELFGAWKADKSGAEAWLAGRDPDTITQANARALASRSTPRRPSPGKDGVPTPRVAEEGATAGPAQPGARGPASQATPANAPTSGASSGQPFVLEVLAGDRRGWLLLDREPPSDDAAWIQFEAADQPEPVGLDEVTLVRISRPKAEPVPMRGSRQRKG